jgi:AcrR family transcriptional regulator
MPSSKPIESSAMMGSVINNSPQRTGRRERRRAATRRRLLNATRTLIAEGGLDAVTINDLTDAADVGFGTFYGYFASKEALVDEVIHDTIELVGDTADQWAADLDDPAWAVAVKVRALLGATDDFPELALVLVRLSLADNGKVGAGLVERLQHDVVKGVGAGRFRSSHLATLSFVVSGAITFVARARLEGALQVEADREVAGQILQLLGIGESEADEIANRPMPTTHREWVEQLRERAFAVA